MDTRNGDLYESAAAARAAGVPDDALVELHGDETAVKKVQRLVREALALAPGINVNAAGPKPEPFRHHGGK